MIIYLFQFNSFFSIIFSIKQQLFFCLSLDCTNYFRPISQRSISNVQFRNNSLIIILAINIFSAELLVKGIGQNGMTFENVDDAIIKLEAFQLLEFFKIVFFFIKRFFPFVMVIISSK